jgi:hypothetical protein
LAEGQLCCELGDVLLDPAPPELGCDGNGDSLLLLLLGWLGLCVPPDDPPDDEEEDGDEEDGLGSCGIEGVDVDVELVAQPATASAHAMSDRKPGIFRGGMSLGSPGAVPNLRSDLCARPA